MVVIWFSLAYHLIVQKLWGIFHKYLFNFPILPTNMKPSLVPRVPRDHGFCDPVSKTPFLHIFYLIIRSYTIFWFMPKPQTYWVQDQVDISLFIQTDKIDYYLCSDPWNVSLFVHCLHRNQLKMGAIVSFREGFQK